MTKEERELLLKDLSARLSYGVKVLNTAEGLNKICKLYSIMTARNGNDCFVGLTLSDDSIMTGIEMVKPYLRPLISMNEEEKKIIADKCGFSFKGPIGGKVSLVMSVLAVDWLLDFYNKNHFDYRGLIERELAIAITEENNPYKE
jgi:hypothetical protein